MSEPTSNVTSGSSARGRATPPTRGALASWSAASIGRVLSALRATRFSAATATVSLLIASGWIIIYVAGGADYAPPHWFYFPILVAASRFGVKGVVVTAAASGLVAGPLMPADVAKDIPQVPSDEIIRAAFFLVIGTLMAAIIWRLEDVLSHEADITAHKAAVISTVSHEFRTPLSVLLGSARMLLHQREWPEFERTLLEGIDGSARRMNDLVGAVLAVSEGTQRAEELSSKLVPLADVISAVATGTAPRDAGRIRVDVGHIVVLTDPPILETVLRNLVDNALRFSPPASPVDITASVSEADPGLINVVVGDRGPGVDEDFLPRAFDAFTQQDGSRTRETGGLGIGLFVARQLATYLGAELELRHRAGGGTEARVVVKGLAAVTLGVSPDQHAPGSSVSRAGEQ
jgi:signal transduction histidine kinase